MFSRTTMASSIRMPIASERPSSDIVLSVKPKAHTAMNDGQHRHRQRESRDHRGAPGVQEEEDHEHREQRALDQRLLDVLRTAWLTRSPAFCTIGELGTSGGSVFCSSRDLLLNRRCDMRRAVALRLLQDRCPRPAFPL
jgi:hypothetical protein